MILKKKIEMKYLWKVGKSHGNEFCVHPVLQNNYLLKVLLISFFVVFYSDEQQESRKSELVEVRLSEEESQGQWSVVHPWVLCFSFSREWPMFNFSNAAPQFL